MSEFPGSLEWVDDAIEVHARNGDRVSESERRALVERLDTLLEGPTESRPWDRLRNDCAGFHDERGWVRIAEYVGDRPLLLKPAEIDHIWRLGSGEDLKAVIGDCPAFEFYAFDESLSYAICFNHHNFIIGWGLASSWVDSLTP